MLEQIVLILLKAVIAPLILEIIKNQPDRGEEFLLASLRIGIATIVGIFLAGFISVLIEVILSTSEIKSNSPLGVLLIVLCAIFIWWIANKLIRN